MSNKEISNKVLIVGAGPGGLALAQGLRKQNIPFQIFERDDVAHVRKQGWAVALSEGLTALNGILPDDLDSFDECSVNHAIGEPDELAIIDAKTGKQLGFTGGVKKGEKGYLLRADRDGLRKHLWKHIDITLGKNFDHYEEDAEGVTVYFKDGSHYRGAILVAADGAHSHIRAQLMADTPHDPVLADYSPLIGEIDFPPEKFEPIRAHANAVIIAGAHDVRVMLGQRSIEADKSSAAWYYAVMYRSKDAKAEAVWAEKATQEQLFQKALQWTEGMDPLVVDAITYGGPTAIVAPPIKFLEFVPPDKLPVSRVTLMGDAAHPMIPFKAAGANTALSDAADLAKILTAHIARGGPVQWLDALQEYEAKMLPRGQEKVLASRAAGQTDDGITAATDDRTATRKT